VVAGTHRRLKIRDAVGSSEPELTILTFCVNRSELRTTCVGKVKEAVGVLAIAPP
jgi:hypothetical protein